MVDDRPAAFNEGETVASWEGFAFTVLLHIGEGVVTRVDCRVTVHADQLIAEGTCAALGPSRAPLWRPVRRSLSFHFVQPDGDLAFALDAADGDGAGLAVGHGDVAPLNIVEEEAHPVACGEQVGIVRAAGVVMERRDATAELPGDVPASLEGVHGGQTRLAKYASVMKPANRMAPSSALCATRP